MTERELAEPRELATWLRTTYPLQGVGPVTLMQRERIHEAATLLERLSSSEVTEEWLPIESAPLETRIMLWCPEVQRKNEGQRFNFGSVVELSGGERKVYGDGMNGDWLFTHWRPLPEPPRSAATSKEQHP